MSLLFLFVLLLFSTPAVLSDNDDESAFLEMKKQLGDPDFAGRWVKGFQFCPGSSFYKPVPPFTFTGQVNVECTDSSPGRVRTLIFDSLENISAPFPEAICSLTELTLLVFYRVPGFYGHIPSCIAKLSKLEELDIIETSFSGSLSDIYNSISSLTKLRKINLPGNHFSGTIPSSFFSSLPELYYLFLSSNNLTGNIPPGLFHRPYSMHFNPVLSLSNNYLTGEIPKCFGTVDFSIFDVRNNHLSGDASFLFGKRNTTQDIILANNDFEFDLSNVEFSEYLSTVDLSHNRIYGKVPDSFAKNEHWYFDPNLSFNKLCGELPRGGNMGKFRPEVFANNSCLCGSPLPAC